MRRLIALNGATVRVDDKLATQLLAGGYKPADATTGKGGESETADLPKGYAAMKAADLKAEIEKRNADREDDAKLPTTGNKSALVAALEDDDESNQPHDEDADEDPDADEDDGEEPESESGSEPDED